MVDVRLFGKILKVVRSIVIMFGCSVLFTVLKPFVASRNRAIAAKAKELDALVVRNLRCGARSVYVRLPKNNIDLHVVEIGNPHDKLVVFIHGFPDTWHSWSGVMPALAGKDLFLIAPDMRGYNLSDKPKPVSAYTVDILASDIADLLTYYNKTTAILVAHDWGGVAAWRFAYNYPEKLEKLVILNSPNPYAYQRVLKTNINQALASWYVFFFQVPFLPANLITYSPYLSANFLFGSTVNKDAVSQESKDVLATSYVQEGALPAMLNYYKAFIRQMFYDMIFGKPKKSGPKRALLEMPILILWGEKDVALTKEVSRLDGLATNVQYQYFNASHWLQYEQPEGVSKAVLAFIKNPQPASPVSSIPSNL